MSIKYIITGTGRCGTMFMANFLTSAGINCGHEIIFNYNGLNVARGIVKMYPNLTADSSYMAAPYLSSDVLEQANIIHLVREPMKVINSFVVAYLYFLSNNPTCLKNSDEWVYEYPPGADPEFKFMNFMWSHAPELSIKKITSVERAALYYVIWNEMIEKACKGRNFLFYPIESDITHVTKFLGIEKTKLYNNKETNKSVYEERYALEDVRHTDIKSRLLKISDRYGYTCSKLKNTQKLL